MLEIRKSGSNACDTKRRTVRGSGLFSAPGVAIAADGGCVNDVVQRMNGGIERGEC